MADSPTSRQQPPHQPPPQPPPRTENPSEPASPLSPTAGSVSSGGQPNTSSAADTATTLDGSVETPNTSSWSAGSEHQLGHGGHGASPDPNDRVFPIRSVVSVDPRSRATSQTDYFPRVPDPASTNSPQRQSTSHLEPTPESPRETTTTPPPGTDTAPETSVASPTYMQPTNRRQGAFTGSYSSVHADAVRQGNPVPITLFSGDGSEKSEGSGATGSQGTALAEMAVAPPHAVIDETMVVPRFKHVVTDDGHAVITGRDGVLQRCEEEPIHAPGAVQAFGVILTLREETDGRFLVRHVSENSERIIGYSPGQLFQLDNFLDILSEEQKDNLLDHVDFVRDEDADPAINGPEVFSMVIRPPQKKAAKVWCAMHVNPTQPDLVICEFELEDDPEFPLRPPEEIMPLTPEDTLHSNPTLEELSESTEILSKPLRVLRSARRKKGEAGAMQVFDIMSQVQEQLSSAPNIDMFLKVLVGIVKELTGFHRVMIYQFDSSFNGKVVTELIDASQTVDLYKGLRFPASDIPKQARELYRLNKVRILYDRDQETARLVCRGKEDIDPPLDMSHSYLRAMSPIHLKYLANMAVRSSMSISINAFNQLWGLIACHSYGPKGMRVPFPIRKMCRLVGDTASRNIERLSYASRLQARKLINTQPTDKNPSGYIVASSDDLLKLFDADFGMLSIQGETKIMGKIDQSQEVLAMLEYLRMRKLTAVTVCHDIREEFPELRYPPGFSLIAGILYVPLSTGGSDFIVFCRRGQVRDVKWAGNPYEKNYREGTAGYLEPRTSFSLWRERVVGKCRDWTEEHVETAAVLCLVYGKFIEVWRQKEAVMESSRLTKLLLANSAHEVRTPLNAIINYLEIALEGSLDQETRDNLAKSHSASKSLIYVINDLLDLTKTEEGQDLIKEEPFDLPQCFRETAEDFRTEAMRKGIQFEITEHPGIPRFVHGDSRRVRQALSNICANAFQHTSKGFVKLELFGARLGERQACVEIVVTDSGSGMKTDDLDKLFRELEQVSTEDDGTTSSTEKKREGRILGLGLAMVARIVRNMDGQLRLKSEEGKGSRFVIQLQFHVPHDSPEPYDAQDTTTAGYSPSASTATSGRAEFPVVQTGEITLVDRGSPGPTSSVPPSTMALTTKRQEAAESSEDTASLRSFKSGSSKSEAERLIDAIQTPLSYQQPQYSQSAGRLDSPESTKADKGPSVMSQPQLQLGGGVSSGADDGSESNSGSAPLPHSRTSVKPAKMPDDYFERDHSGGKQEALSEAHPDPPPITSRVHEVEGGSTAGSVAGQSMKDGDGQTRKLNVLVAEDDPINIRVLAKRLEKAGHKIHHAVNGEACATVYREKSADFDVVLMDIQMPIVDGLTSTKLIRSWENDPGHGGHSSLAEANGQIPIFAVSASLVEKDRGLYMDAGFDGWILKPIDFKRLNTLLMGIGDVDMRNQCLYEPGVWERGGWFSPRHPGRLMDDEDETPRGK